jgi:ATP-dependent DNA helicase PIF1
VPSYTEDDIKNIIASKLQNAEHVNSITDNALLKKLDEAAKSYLYENFTVQPLSTDFPPDVMIDYQMSKVHGQSSDIFDTDLDLKAFPELYPTGENGMRDAHRVVRIGSSDFIKSRLLNKDPKFRLNVNYLFHCFQQQEISHMCHSVGHMLRCVTGNNLSAKAFYDRLVNRDGETQSQMFSLMANMRGSKEYFAKLGMDVKWMIRRLGPPTVFLTCSTAEWFSDSFIQYLRTINSSISNIEKMTPSELCAMDPVNVSIHFKKKWDAIFNKLIRAKENPIFGKVQDFFWRIEYQSRGAPHVHCILWIENAPIIGTNSNDEITKYINSIVTCAKPDMKTSPTLSTLVSKFQTHVCN